MAKLRNRRHELFAQEVACGAPLASAYVLAGYTNSKFAKFNGSRLANSPAVKVRIDELQKEFAERSGIKAEYLQQRLLPLVEADAADFYETIDDGAGRKVHRLRSLADLPRQLRAAIKSIECDPVTGTPTKITLHDKIAAGTTLLRSVGGFVDKTELTGRDGGPLTLEQLVLASFEKARPAAAGDAAAAGSPGDGAYRGAEPEPEPEQDP